MSLTHHGTLLGARVASQIEGGVYRVLIEQTSHSADLAVGFGWAGEVVEVEGRAWWVISYTAELDAVLQEAVDALADLRFHRPGYGQLVLFQEAPLG